MTDVGWLCFGGVGGGGGGCGGGGAFSGAGSVGRVGMTKGDTRHRFNTNLSSVTDFKLVLSPIAFPQYFRDERSTTGHQSQ